MMILKWTMSSKKWDYIMTATRMMKKMIINQVYFFSLYFERNQY
jgi:hypothetical protein